MLRYLIAFFCSLIVAVLITTPVNADAVNFHLIWDGASFGNTARAEGDVTIDTTQLPNPGSYFGPFTGSPFSLFTLTVTGASSGNGTFTSAGGDFDFVIWDTFGVLDLDLELVGQFGGFDDYNVLSASGSGAPSGVGQFELATSESTGDSMILVSMIATPEPSSTAVLLIAGVGFVMRRRRTDRN